MDIFLCDTIPELFPYGTVTLGDLPEGRVSALDVSYAQQLRESGLVTWNDYVRTVLRFIDSPTGTILDENVDVPSYEAIWGEL